MEYNQFAKGANDTVFADSAIWEMDESVLAAGSATRDSSCEPKIDCSTCYKGEDGMVGHACPMCNRTEGNNREETVGFVIVAASVVFFAILISIIF